jgi:Primase zinc finger
LRLTENATPLALSGQTPLSSAEGAEAVLEVGLARDFAQCEAARGDGSRCAEWVDRRKEKLCEWHAGMVVKRARKGRMEYAVGQRAYSPKKTRRPNLPPMKKTSAPDSWEGGGGSVYHAGSTTEVVPVKKPAIEGIKRSLKEQEQERELRSTLKAFRPVKPPPPPPAPVVPAPVELPDSRAFDPKRVREIGFDPRRRADEDVRPVQESVAPIKGKICMDGVLSTIATKEGAEGSDSDSDLDIVMT